MATNHDIDKISGFYIMPRRRSSSRRSSSRQHSSSSSPRRNLSKLNINDLHIGNSYQVVYYNDDSIAITEILKLTQKSKYSNSNNYKLVFKNNVTGNELRFNYDNDDLISVLVPQQGGVKSRRNRLQQRKSRKLLK